MPWREFFFGRGRRRPERAVPLVDPSPGWLRPPETGLRATWLGHSTLLVEIDGTRILTDPVWGERASPVRHLGPRRFHPVPVELGALPTIDLVLISHDHYDHLDYSTIRRLAAADVPFAVPLGVGAHLEAWGVAADRITELDWWERIELPSASVTAAPAQHFSGRGPVSRNHTLWSSFAIEGSKHRVYFGGDTGFTEQFSEIHDRLGPFDLVALEIGAFHPAWRDVHMGPVGALKAVELLGGAPFLPIHWGTFDLSTHDWDQPIEVVTEGMTGPGAVLLTPRPGEPIEPAMAGAQDMWWRAVGDGPPKRRGAAETIGEG